jgi:hypothetical protein
MGRLEDWYGVEQAQKLRTRRSSGFGSAILNRTPPVGADTGADVKVTSKEEALLMVAQTNLAEKMQRVLTLLQVSTAAAIEKVQDKPFITEEVRTNYLKALAQIKNSAIPTRAASAKEVLAGTLSVERWLAACGYIEALITEYLTDINEETYLANFKALFYGVAVDVRKAATTVSEITLSIGRLLEKIPKVLDENAGVIMLAAMGLLGFVAYQYLTSGLRFLPAAPRRLSGYKGHSTHRRSRK